MRSYSWKSWLLLSTVMMAVLTVPAIGIYQMLQIESHRPQAVRGVLDLRGWNFEQNGLAALDGQWEFYPNQLLDPSDFPSAESPRGEEGLASAAMIQVPGAWNPSVPSGAIGYGTYRLRVLLDQPAAGRLGIKADNIRMASRVYLNGQNVGGSGTPSQQFHEGEQNNVPYIGFTEVQGSEVEVIVQVSNYIYASGGIVSEVWFGDDNLLIAKKQREGMNDMLSLCFFMLPGAFFILLSRLRRWDLPLLYLGLMCAAASFYILTHGEKLLSQAVPELSYLWVLRIQGISSSLVYLFLFLYVDALVKGVVHRFMLRLASWLTLFMVAAALFLPMWVFSSWGAAMMAASLVLIIYTIYIMAKWIQQRPKDAGYMLVSVLSMIMVIVLNLAYVFGLMETRLLSFFELGIFVLAQVLMLVRRFASSFDENERLTERLLTLDGLKDEFMAKTSHELRTPLHGMINMAESMLDGASGRLSRQQQENLAIIKTTGQRLTLLVNDILDFSKLNHGGLVLNLNPVHLPSVVQSVLEVMEHSMGSRPLKMVQDWPDTLPPVYSDEERLQQILYHLLGNAVKFTAEGTVTITAVACQNGMVQVTVRDTGVGIARHRLKEIFEAYVNEAHTEDRQAESSGLGLNITKRLIELGGGTIWAESELGQGSAFHFTLPSALAAPDAVQAVHPLSEVKNREQTAAAGYDQEAAELQPSLPLFAPRVLPELPAAADECTGRILIVDDDPVNLKVLTNLLTTEQYQVTAVESGEAALAILWGQTPYDLVITDWMMPGMSGIELCREIRTRRSLAELPILILTARNLREDQGVGFKAGANDFLIKPVDAGGLRARVRTLISMRQSAQNATRTEMAFLQAQIKPHFLYNALNVIIATCPVNPDKATDLLIELSQYLRGSFDFRNQDHLVPLAKELELVESYVALESARFEDRLKFESEVDDDILVQVPPLTIQPLVENAIRHGIMQRAAGGCVRLSIRDTGSSVVVSITDDGIGISAEHLQSIQSGVSPSGGVGLMNIQRRLQAMYGQGLQIEPLAAGGTEVRFELPKALTA
ncbi:ATP-binding protein [Paenibacillus sp. JX-17]|uniref:histidine kinase n=1 Tax=Paenibacillus lacisoli TaxID=3064525 RepID=A0ABT9CFE9_9BACL|nr:ATP-binding protein [Paenibacillus sp. JX-17]MDO7906328.1 ATP-binding protein [Paenibacillus sp. JX-17]